MATKKVAYLRNTGTGKEYKIVRLDKANGMVWLKGEGGVEFDEEFNPDRLKKFGYELIQKDEEIEDESE